MPTPLPPGFHRESYSNPALPPGFRRDTVTLSQPNVEAPGVIQRFLEATGLPTSKAEYKAMRPSTAEIIGGPAVTAGKLVLNYGKNLYQRGKSAGSEIKSDIGNIRAGQPVVPNLGAMAEAGTEFGLRGLLAPVGGGAIQTGGEDFESGNLPGFTGDVLGTIANLLMFDKSRPVSDEVATNKLAFAAGKGTTEPITTALSDIRSTAREAKPRNVNDFLDVVNRSKDDMNKEVGQAMFPVQHYTIVPTGVSQRILSLITPNMSQTAEGRAAIQQIKSAAREFEKPWTVQQLDAERMKRYADLNTFNKKDPVARYAAKNGSVNIAIDDAVNQAIRDTVYPILDTSAGKSPGYFANLKRRQSALIDLQSTLDKRTKELRDITARTKGAPRISGENVSLYGHPTGGVGSSVHRLQDIIIRPNPEKQAARRVRQTFGTGNITRIVRPSSRVITATLPVRLLSTLPEGENQ